MKSASDDSHIKLGYFTKCELSTELQASDESASSFICNGTTFQAGNDAEL